MKTIEPSGVIMKGICSLQTDKCVANQSPAAITAVWGPPGRTQVDVCAACLQEMIRTGEWEIQGARIEKRADLTVYAPNGKPQLAVEVKQPPSIKSVTPLQWATQVYRNLLVHAGIPNTPYFLLAVFPDSFYLWKKTDSTSIQPPDYNVQVTDLINKYQPKYPGFESQIMAWLQDLIKSKFSTEEKISLPWLFESGLYEAIQNGSIVK